MIACFVNETQQILALHSIRVFESNCRIVNGYHSNMYQPCENATNHTTFIIHHTTIKAKNLTVKN